MTRSPVIRLDLDQSQLKELANALAPVVVPLLADALLPHIAAGLAVESYTIDGWARANDYSTGYIRDEIANGNLIAVRPGGGARVRILAADGLLWLRGQKSDGDMPVTGFAPAVSERNRIRRTKRRT